MGDEVEHVVNQPRRGKDFPMVDDALFRNHSFNYPMARWRGNRFYILLIAIAVMSAAVAFSSAPWCDGPLLGVRRVCRRLSLVFGMVAQVTARRCAVSRVSSAAVAFSSVLRCDGPPLAVRRVCRHLSRVFRHGGIAGPTGVMLMLDASIGTS